MFTFIKAMIDSMIADMDATTTISHTYEGIGLHTIPVHSYIINYNSITMFNERFCQALELTKQAIHDSHSSYSISTDTSKDDMCYMVTFLYQVNYHFRKIELTVTYEG